MNFRKAAIYTLIVSALVLANLWRTGLGVFTVSPGDEVDRAALETAKLTGLSTALFPAGFGSSEKRDLFRFELVKPEILSPPVAPPPLHPPVAQNAERRAVEKIFENISVLGTFADGDRIAVLIRYEEKLHTLHQGNLLMPGFRVISISLAHVEIRNETLEIGQLFSLGDDQPAPPQVLQ